MNEGNSQQDPVVRHYESIWQSTAAYFLAEKGPVQKMHANFRVLEFEPYPGRSMWTYATSGMSSSGDLSPIELHLFSDKKDRSLIELLTAVAYYHKNTCRLDLNDFVNFGRSWQDDSICEFGFISLPYLDGPELEGMCIGGKVTRFYWLIPVTAEEKRFAVQNGIEALENEFEKGFNYVDANRRSLI